MPKRLNMTGKGRGGPLGLQTILRLMTILIVIVGVAYLGPIYYRRIFGAKPAPAVTPDNTTEEVTYDIDLRRFPLPTSPDNLPVVPSSDDNAADVRAIVGLESIRDGATIEAQPLYYLLREVETRRPADNLFMRRAPVVALSELRADPDKFRLKPVIIRGTIGRVERSSLAENPSGIREVLEGELVVGREGICMFITSRVGRVRVGQTVELRGLFVKLVTYGAKGGTQESAPLVVASHPVFAGAEGKGPVGGASWHGLLVVLVLLFVVYFVMMFVLRRRQQGRNALLEARRKARRLTSGASSRTAPDEPEEMRDL